MASRCWWKVGAGVVGAVGTVAATPFVLTAAGFTVMTSQGAHGHSGCDGCNQRDKTQHEEKSGGICWWKLGAGAVGAVGAVAATPVVLTAVGFTTGGIAAGSLAAWVMSLSGNVAAGGVISILQAAGAAGLGVSGTIVTGAAGGAAGYTVGSYTEGKDCGK